MAKKKTVKKAPLSNDEKIIKEEFGFALKVAKNNSAAFKHVNARIPSNHVLKRRKSATLAYMDYVRTHYGNQNPHLDIGREWAKQNSVISMDADNEDHYFYLTLAAAIWMLDMLRQHDLLKETYQYLSMDTEELDSLNLPNIFDPCHNETVIRGMVHLIQNRDGGTDLPRHYITDTTALRRSSPPSKTSPLPDTPNLNKDEQNLTSRNRFDAVMGLIPQELKDRAAQRFEEKLWDFFDRYFLCLNNYNQELEETVQENDRIWNQLMDVTKNTPFSSLESPIPTAHSVLNVSAAKAPVISKQIFDDHSTTGEVSSSLSLRASLETAMALSTRGMESEVKIEELERACHALTYASHMSSIMPRNHMEDNFSSDVLDTLLSLHVDDPYEVCFAYLYLLDSGSDLPWLCNGSVAVLLAAARKLPWMVILGANAFDDFDNEDEYKFDGEEDIDEDMSYDGESFGETDSVPLTDRNEKMAWLYDLNYSDSPLYLFGRSNDSAWKLNLPQLIFAETGLIMPRPISSSNERIQEYIEAGLDPNMAIAMDLYLQLALDVQFSSKDYESEVLSERFNEILESLHFEKEPEEPSKEESIENLRAQLSKLKAQNDELRQALYAATKEAEKEKAAITKSNMERVAEQQELYDLRELIFNQANDHGANEESALNPDIKWPYVIKKRVVVFGGHESWLKAIRPLLPTVIFARSENPNAELIRNADTVWIQANALSHKSYYKIINNARTYRVPVRYFGYASAKKCASQLAQDS